MPYELFLCYIKFVLFLVIITKQNFNRITTVLVIIICDACQFFFNSIFVTINMVPFNSITQKQKKACKHKNMPSLSSEIKKLYFLKKKK